MDVVGASMGVGVSVALVAGATATAGGTTALLVAPSGSAAAWDATLADGGSAADTPPDGVDTSAAGRVNAAVTVAVADGTFDDGTVDGALSAAVGCTVPAVAGCWTAVVVDCSGAARCWTAAADAC